MAKYPVGMTQYRGQSAISAGGLSNSRSRPFRAPSGQQDLLNQFMSKHGYGTQPSGQPRKPAPGRVGPQGANPYRTPGHSGGARDLAARQLRNEVRQTQRALARAATPAQRKLLEHILAKYGLRVGLKLGLRFVPYLNLILLAWDLYEFWQLFQNLNSFSPQYAHGGRCADTAFQFRGVSSAFCTGLNGSVDPSVTLPGWGTTNYNFGDGLKPALACRYHSATKIDGTPNPATPTNNTGKYAGWDYVRRYAGETAPSYPGPSTTPQRPPLPDVPTKWPEPFRPTWEAPSSKPEEPTWPQPGPKPVTPPSPRPSLPSSLPTFEPAVFTPLSPWPEIVTPYPWLLPWAPPVQVPGMPPLPQPKPRPHPVKRVTPDWWPTLPENARPSGEPGLPKPPAPLPSVRLSPGAAPVRGKDPHKMRKPGRKTRERKGRIYGMPGGLIGKIINGITEVKDAIESVYDAMPQDEKCRNWRDNGRRSLTLPKKIMAMKGKGNLLDMEKVVTNLIKDQIEDQFYGRTAKAFSKAYARLDAHKTGGIANPSRRIPGAPNYDKTQTMAYKCRGF